MREVRMTFGEHLEDLRKRLLHSVVWLVCTVILCFAFGEELMELTLGPHRNAIKGALQERLILRMETSTETLVKLIEGRDVSDLEPIQIDSGSIRWEVLFPHDVAYPTLKSELLEPFTAATTAISESSALTPPQKAEMTKVLDQLGEGLSERIAREFSPSVTSDGRYGNVMSRLERIDDLIATIESKASPSEAAVLIGLGASVQRVRQTFDQFKAFLAGRQAEAKKSPLTAIDLKAQLQHSKLPAFLDRVLGKIEDDAVRILDPRGMRLMVIHYMENFMAYLKVALIFGLGGALPFILYEMWKFVGAGLYHNEQKYVVVFLPFSLGLFVAGILFGYFAMIPVGLQFLASWGAQDVDLSFTLGNYIGLFFTLTLLMGLVFQIPLVMVFLAKIDVVRPEGFRRGRKAAIFFGVCGAALITPPDPFTLLLMAGPLVLLYEVGIIVGQFLTKNDSSDDEDQEDIEPRPES